MSYLGCVVPVDAVDADVPGALYAAPMRMRLCQVQCGESTHVPSF